MMSGDDIPRTPDVVAPIQIDTEALGFTMASESKPPAG
jgi:hypothetical protein